MTTMAEFAMCPDCLREYKDPENRRFHAQPNACPLCGPHLELVIPSSSRSSENSVLKGHGFSRAEEAGEESGLQPPRDGAAFPQHPRALLSRVADILRSGGIVAWKGLGGYQLACDARQPAAVEELRRRKHRSEKPFAVMVANEEVAASLCFVSAEERAALTSRERPIVLLRRRAKPAIGDALAEAVSPGNPATGVMLPCTPMHDLLFRILRKRWISDPALVMTSGNISEEPIVIDNAEAEERLAAVADAFVHHNRRIHTRVDDSVVRVVAGETIPIRRARGYAPSPVFLGRGEAEVLACGAQQKNTLCLTRAGFAIPSQHLGDLENYETLRFFEETFERMSRLFHVTPTAVAYDLHPGYLSAQFALGLPNIEKIGVQHHHAHIASCMAEHQLEGQVIGVAWDGTGFGTDATIWGGEFLSASYLGFERYARLRPILLPGGDSGVREPWRVARSYLMDTFGSAPTNRWPTSARFSQKWGSTTPSASTEEASNFPARFWQKWEAEIPPERLRVVDQMLAKKINTIPTSSAGRLFDAVASLIGLRHTVSFEGQAAMMLEATATSEPLTDPYDFSINSNLPIDIDLRPMIRQILAGLEAGEPQSRLAARFHATLVAVIAEVCRSMRADLQLNRVCLSGGCFQNALLLEGSVNALRRDGFEVFTHREVPANDGGISLGQAAIACEQLRQQS